MLSGRVLLYAALPDEVDLSALFPEVELVLPRVVGHHLTLHRVRSLDALSVGAWGIREPSTDCEQIPPRDVDLAVIPGRAFDERGGRLGRGKGFYDRALVELRADVTRVGVCFDCQLVDAVPRDSHDVEVHQVLTEVRDVRVSRG